MDFLVKSQSKIGIFRIIGIRVCENTIYGLQDCRDSYGIRLGEYKTKKSVLKVLSDIKRFIKFNNVSNKVFNMPKE